MYPEGLDFLVIYGKSGCGKSDILRRLSRIGEQVLDLEYLARHNGSAFGSLTGDEQPAQEEFEQEIWKQLAMFSPGKTVWVEYESGYIGKLQIPRDLADALASAPVVIVRRERDQRIQRLVNEYSIFQKEDLLGAASKIKKKVSHKKYRLLRRSISEGDYHTAASILLTWYDKVYENGRLSLGADVLMDVELNGAGTETDADLLLDGFRKLPKSRNPM